MKDGHKESTPFVILELLLVYHNGFIPKNDLRLSFGNASASFGYNELG
ncbi:hypothetical protein OXB_0046 [Bacillus sp. OxB-1]|nr:hypothetical protein OXB_0046 [Bacillus sp. OxB-1]